MVFSRHSSETEGDFRHVWYDTVLNLALEKTREKYGSFRFARMPVMPSPRTWETIRSNRYPNLFFAAPYEKKLANQKNIVYIEFPLQFGLLGYRVCFTAQSRKDYVYRTFDQGFVSKLTIGQGTGWADNKILQANGYRVIEVNDYADLFRMTAAARFDLFCRGINEVHDEYIFHKNQLPIYLDTQFAFRYDFPVFFFTNSANAEAIERVETGLELTYADGSLLKVFQDYYSERLRHIKLSERKIIHLANPEVKRLDETYKVYNYSPLQLSPPVAAKK